MSSVFGIDFFAGSREEHLPDFSADFPYIATCARFEERKSRIVPWHWHKTVEIFFIKRGCLE